MIFGTSATVNSSGTVEGAASKAGGHTIVTADSLDDATAMAKGCPVLATGGNVEVYEAAEMQRTLRRRPGLHGAARSDALWSAGPCRWVRESERTPPSARSSRRTRVGGIHNLTAVAGSGPLSAGLAACLRGR